MPRFYFNVYNANTVMDGEGLELVDVEAARREAVKSVRELICDDVRHGGFTLSHRIEVEDEGRRLVLSLTFGETVEIRS